MSSSDLPRASRKLVSSSLTPIGALEAPDSGCCQLTFCEIAEKAATPVAAPKAANNTAVSELLGFTTLMRMEEVNGRSLVVTLPEDALRRTLQLVPSPLTTSLVCRVFRTVSRQVRTTIVLSGWTESWQKLRWALSTLGDLKLILENVTDWEQLQDYVSGPSLKALDVRCDRELGPSNRWDGKAYAVCVEPLARLVAACSGLQDLHLAGCNIGSLCDLGPALCDLRLLDLDGNGLGDEGCAVLCSDMPITSGLQHLSLSNNAISAQGAHAVSELLAKCPQLQVLKLDANALGDAGCGTIAGVLHMCPQLATVSCSENGIGVSASTRSGWVAIASELLRTLSNGSHTKLKMLDCTENGVNGLDCLHAVCSEYQIQIVQSHSFCGDCGLCEDCEARFF